MFFQAEDRGSFEELHAKVATLPELPARRRYDDPKDVWFRQVLASPCVHPRFACAVEHVPIIPPALLPAETGIDGRPRESRIASAIAILCRRHAEYCLLLERYPTTAETPFGTRMRQNLQGALERYLAAAVGEHVSDVAPEQDEEDEEDEYFESLEGSAPRECRFNGDDVIIGWTDGSWTRTGPSGTSPMPAQSRVRFFEDRESSLLRSPDGRVHALTQVADYPVVVAPSQDGAYVWVADKEGSGGVFDVETGLLAAACRRARDPVRTLTRDGVISALEDEQIEDALVSAYEAQRVLSDGWSGALAVVQSDSSDIAELHFYDGVTPRGTLVGFPSFTQAFDATAERLAMVDDREVLILRLSDDVIERRYPLVAPKS